MQWNHKEKKKNKWKWIDINLAAVRTFFIDLLTDDMTKLQSNCWSGVCGPNGLRNLFFADKIVAWIGETLGGGSKFKRPGVNERLLRIDIVYGDKNMLGEAMFIGDNGNSGEFGVCNLLNDDILYENEKKRNPEKCSCKSNVAN